MKKNPRYTFWQLPVIADARGSLCPIEFSEIPFKPQRIYFLEEVKSLRGGHAHKDEDEVFVCVKGSFRATIHDGKLRRRFLMKKPGQALYTSRMVWHEFDRFTPDAIMMAISSTPYKGRQGYIMNLEEFKKLCRKKFS